MTPAIFSTGNLSRADQFEAWRQWFRPVFDVSTPEPDMVFPAVNKIWDLEGLVVSCVTAPPVAATRSRGNIAKAPVDHWVLSCCRRGVMTVQTPRALLKAPQGVPFVWSLGEKSQSRRTEVARVQILLPRDKFQDIAPILDSVRGSVINTQMGLILGEYMVSLEHWLSNLTPEGLRRMAPAVCSMIAACLAPSAERMEQANDELAAFRADKVRKAVRDHLRSPSLDPDTICRLVGISRSSLYRMFTPYGGIVRYIQRERLQQAHVLLADPANRSSVSTISEALCFSDTSSFSRAFKREFGYSPSEVRASATNGKPMQPHGQSRQRTYMTNFGDVLRTA